MPCSTSSDRPNGQAALHLVSVWAGTNHLVFGQVAVEDQANEVRPQEPVRSR
jgi:hypothetical protein